MVIGCRLVFTLVINIFRIYGAGVGPVKATGTQWIYYKIFAVRPVIEKYSLYTQHMQNVISTKSDAREWSRLEVNTIKIGGCKSIAALWPLHRYLAEDKIFSVLTQRSNITDVLDVVQSTKQN